MNEFYDNDVHIGNCVIQFDDAFCRTTAKSLNWLFCTVAAKQQNEKTLEGIAAICVLMGWRHVNAAWLTWLLTSLGG